eukprot:496476_1
MGSCCCGNKSPRNVFVTSPDDIITFWYGDLQTFDEELSMEEFKKQMTPNKEFDEEIRNKFADFMDDVLNKNWEYYFNHQLWGNDTDGYGLAALLIITDQFTRNVYRGTKKSFLYDKYSEEIMKKAEQTNYIKNIFHKNPVYILLFGIAAEHFEDMTWAQKSVDILKYGFETLKNMGKTNHSVFKILEKAFNDENSNMWTHYHMIKKYNRYLQRDHILGREQTKEEEEYLQQSGMNALIYIKSD